MKKVIIGILIGIAICVICVTIYVQCFMSIPDKGGMINEDVEFGGYTSSEWEKMIENFYDNNFEFIPEIKCFYNEKGEFIAETVSENEEKYVYVFNKDTLNATREDGVVIDFINEKYIGSKVNFSDNQCLAIGYVLDNDVYEFASNNFFSAYMYDCVEVFDYRSAESKEKQIGNRFVIIPKTEDVKVSLYNCFINNYGELELDNILIKDYTDPFIILDDYLAETTTPEMCIKFEYNGFEETFPIVFSGMDGKLDLTGVEGEVKDISIY